MEGALDEANAELRSILKKMWKRAATDKVSLSLNVLDRKIFGIVQLNSKEFKNKFLIFSVIGQTFAATRRRDR